MESIRKVLCKHLGAVRDCIIDLLTVDSGAYKTDELSDILLHPEITIHMETSLLQDLLQALQIINRYSIMIDRWSIHVNGLVKNLGATPDQQVQFSRQEVNATQLFESKSYEQEYLRWVLADAAQEVDRLIAASQDLESEGIRLIKLTDHFGGPFFTQVGRIARVWLNTARQDFYTPILEILKPEDDKPEAATIQHKLIRYIDTLFIIIQSTPMFVLEDRTTSYSTEIHESTKEKINQLIAGTEELQDFIKRRGQSYLFLFNEQYTLLRAILPPDTNVARWLVTFGLLGSKNADELLPKEIVIDTLPLAVKQAEEALISWQDAMEAAIPYLNKALTLNDLLQSPVIAKFLDADQHRLELYRKWLPRIVNTFKEVRTLVVPTEEAD